MLWSVPNPEKNTFETNKKTIRNSWLVQFTQKAVFVNMADL